jgi:hypothetical protein
MQYTQALLPSQQPSKSSLIFPQDGARIQGWNASVKLRLMFLNNVVRKYLGNFFYRTCIWIQNGWWNRLAFILQNIQTTMRLQNAALDDKTATHGSAAKQLYIWHSKHISKHAGSDVTCLRQHNDILHLPRDSQRDHSATAALAPACLHSLNGSPPPALHFLLSTCWPSPVSPAL